MKSNKKATAFVIISAMLWGTYGSFVTVISTYGIHNNTMMFLRFLFTSLPVFLYLLGKDRRQLSVKREDLILFLANWAMTTLFEGKGRFKDIYIGMCYALVPYILIQLPMILVSNILTYEEGSLYSVMLSISVIWSVFLVFVGLMEIHDYGPGKTFIFIIVTIVGACVIIFLALVCLSLLSDAIGFFVSLYREAAYRLN